MPDVNSHNILFVNFHERLYQGPPTRPLREKPGIDHHIHVAQGELAYLYTGVSLLTQLNHAPLQMSVTGA